MRPGCPETLQVQGFHVHPPNTSKRAAEKVIGGLKQSVRTEVDAPVVQLYKKGIRDVPAVVQESLPSRYTIETCLRRERRKEAPKLPSTLDEINLDGTAYPQDVLLNSDEDGPRIIVLGNEENCAELCAADRVHMDGTFKIVPILFAQLFIIHALIASPINDTRSRVLPLLYCLLPSKEDDTYDRLFRLLKRKFDALGKTFSPRVVIIDFEAAIHNALKRVFPVVTIKGCYFHFTQAIRTRYQKEGMTDLIFQHPTVRTVVYRCMCMPFVPVDDIPAVFDIISNTHGWDVLPARVDILLHRFIRYFERNWIKSKIGLEKWNVYSTDCRTNNAVEAYNKHLADGVKKHPNLWELLRVLHLELVDMRIEVDQVKTGKMFRPQKKAMRDREELIDAVKDEFANGRTTPLQYLDNIVQIYHPPGSSVRARKRRRRAPKKRREEATQEEAAPVSVDPPVSAGAPREEAATVSVDPPGEATRAVDPPAEATRAVDTPGRKRKRQKNDHDDDDDDEYEDVDDGDVLDQHEGWDEGWE